MAHSIKMLKHVASFPRGNDLRERDQDRSYNVFLNLILEMVYYDFCHILSVTHTNPGIMW